MMTFLAVAFAMFTVLFAGITLFLLVQYKLKFEMMDQFLEHSNQEVKWYWPGARKLGKKPGMRNIVLRSQSGKPFCALVGFTLEVNVPFFGARGYDYYGFVRSNPHGVAVISTYCGRGDAEFRFFVNTDLGSNAITATSESGADQELRADKTFPPHLYQRLGFFG
ncbi:MAG TPA: hypothetical protein VEA18_03400 [Candidatus Kapabacteria bacterium]|nr:hypothetical protein [Candidatus Kapabacteria bacterium]